MSFLSLTELNIMESNSLKETNSMKLWLGIQTKLTNLKDTNF